METYLRLLALPNIVPRMKALLRKEGVWQHQKFLSLHKSELNGFPFLIAVRSSARNIPILYAAYNLLTELDLDPLIKGAGRKVFFLIVVPEKHPLTGKTFVLEDSLHIIVHEVTHLKDQLAFVSAHPEYLADVAKYSGFRDLACGSLRESIRFELGKILRLEPPAYQAEWDMGVRSIPVPVLWMVKDLVFESAEEFARVQIMGNIHDLRKKYLATLPDQQALIDSAFRDSLGLDAGGFSGGIRLEEVLDVYKSVYRKLGVPM